MHFREDKTTQSASIFVKKTGGKLVHTRLMSMLYLADRQMLLRYGDPITYDCWISADQGPMLRETYELIRPNSERGGAYWKRYLCTSGLFVELTCDPGTDDLSKAEEQVIDDVYAECSYLNDFELTEKMLELPEWDDTDGDSLPIPVERVLKGNNYAAADIAAIVDHIGEQEVVYRVIESVR